MALTVKEKGILAICKLNEQEKKIEIAKVWKVGRLKIGFHWRSKKNMWGRFGGGWNWVLGFEASWPTLILNLLIFYLRFDWSKKSIKENEK